MARTIKLRLSERVRKVMCLHHYSIRNEKFDWYWVHNFILLINYYTRKNSMPLRSMPF